MTVQEYLRENPNASAEIQSINSIFHDFNIQVNEVIKGSQNIRYIVNLPLDLKTQGKIRRGAKDIEYALTTALRSNDIIYGKTENYIYIEKKTDAFDVVYFDKYINKMPTNCLNLMLGKDMQGKITYTNLSNAPHILVAGTTGSGKSEVLHSFVLSLIHDMNSTNVALIIIDPKRAEFTPYKDCKRIRVITDMENTPKYFNQLVSIMESRYAELERCKAKDIYHYNGTQDMHPIVVIIDELADLMLSHREIESDIVRIAQKARACGIHLIIGTQRPSRDVVTGLIKANIPTKIALKTSTQVDSRIILDRIGAENLFGKGDMLYLGNGKFEPIRIQSAYVTEEYKTAIADLLYCNKNHTTHQTTQTYQHTQPTPTQPKKKHVGLFQGIANLWNIKPIMFRTDDYPPKI